MKHLRDVTFLSLVYCTLVANAIHDALTRSAGVGEIVLTSDVTYVLGRGNDIIHTNKDAQQSQCRPGSPITGAQAPSIGTLRGAMVFVDFPDAIADESTRDIYDILEPNATQWYSTMSYGKLQLDMVAHLDTFFRMPRSSVSYDFQRGLSAESHRIYIQDALDVIGTSVNFTGSDVLYIVPTQAAVEITYSPTARFAVTAADGTVINNTVTLGADTFTDWGFKVINHETGHTMGLPDLYPFVGGTTVEWVGGYSIMGLITGQSPDYFAYHKWQLGWLEDSQVDCVADNGTSTHRISPVESSGSGTKLVMIPIDEDFALMAEVRSNQGINSAACGVGVLLYFSNSSIVTGEGPIRVIDSSPGSGGCDFDIGGELNDAPFRLGSNATSSYRNETLGLAVDVIDRQDEDYIIRVQRSLDTSSTTPTQSGSHTGSASPSQTSPSTSQSPGSQSSSNVIRMPGLYMLCGIAALVFSVS